MERVLLIGAHGKGNVGDELLTWTAVKLLTSFNPQVTGEILTYNQRVSNDFYVYQNFKTSLWYTYFPSFKYPQSFVKFKMLRNLKNYDLAIFPGGGFLYDYSLPTLLSWLRRFAAIKGLRVPIVILGAGIGPLRTSLSRLLAKRILNYCRMVVVRDTNSYDLVKSIGLNENKLRLGADLSIMLNKFDDYRRKKESAIKRCVVIPRLWPYHHDDKQEDLVIKSFLWLIKMVYQHFHFENITFLPMHRYDDMSLCQKIASNINLSCGMYKIRCYQDVKQPIKDADLVISMRFHGALLSLIAEKPTLTIGYDEKVSSLMSDFQRTQQCLSWEDFAANNETALKKCLDAVGSDDLRNIPSLVEERQKRLINALEGIFDP